MKCPDCTNELTKLDLGFCYHCCKCQVIFYIMTAKQAERIGAKFYSIADSKSIQIVNESVKEFSNEVEN